MACYRELAYSLQNYNFTTILRLLQKLSLFTKIQRIFNTKSKLVTISSQLSIKRPQEVFITAFLVKKEQFLNDKISHGNVAALLTSDGIFNDRFTANLLLSLLVKEF